MNFSLATILAAVIYSGIYVIVLTILLRCKFTFGVIGIRFLCIFSFMAVIRLLLPLEFKAFTVTLPSERIMPWIRDFLSCKMQLGEQRISVAAMIGMIWGIGTIIYLVKIIRAYRCTCQIKMLEKEVSPEVEEIKEQIIREKGVKKKISIIQSQFITVPAIVGITDQVVLLPKQNWSAVELECILRHEMNHARYRDNLAKLLLQIVNGIFWWNPLFYLLRRQIEIIMEFRSDSLTVKELSAGIDIYMESLYNLYMNARFKNHPYMTMFCGSDKKILVRRFQYMLAHCGRKRENPVFPIIVCMGILASSFLVNFEAKYPIKEAEIYSLETMKEKYIIKTKDKHYYFVMNGKIVAEIFDYESSGELKNLPVYEMEMSE